MPKTPILDTLLDQATALRKRAVALERTAKRLARAKAIGDARAAEAMAWRVEAVEASVPPGPGVAVESLRRALGWQRGTMREVMAEVERRGVVHVATDGRLTRRATIRFIANTPRDRITKKESAA